MTIFEVLLMAQLNYLEADTTSYQFVSLNEEWIFKLCKKIVEFGKFNNDKLLKSCYEFIKTVSEDDIQCANKFTQTLIQNLLQIGLQKDDDTRKLCTQVYHVCIIFKNILCLYYIFYVFL